MKENNISEINQSLDKLKENLLKKLKYSIDDYLEYSIDNGLQDANKILDDIALVVNSINASNALKNVIIEPRMNSNNIDQTSIPEMFAFILGNKGKKNNEEKDDDNDK